MKPLYETALSTLDSTVSVPNYLPSVDTPDETVVHARLIRLCTQHSAERGHPPHETAV